MAHAVAVDPTTTVMSCNVIDFCHETLGNIHMSHLMKMISHEIIVGEPVSYPVKQSVVW